MAGSVNAAGVCSIFKTTTYDYNHILKYEATSLSINMVWHKSNSATIGNSNL
jgi:hypothetical protein